jgi:Sigma-70 factor, region 1.1
VSHRTESEIPHMSAADLQELEEVKGLIARGLHIGVLTYAEIASAATELGLEDTDVQELHEVFERCDIELIEEIDPAAAASLTIERAPNRRRPKAVIVRSRLVAREEWEVCIPEPSDLRCLRRSLRLPDGWSTSG